MNAIQVIYLSGPMTLGDRENNYRQAVAAQMRLVVAGYSVINPMLAIPEPEAWKIDHATWLAHDMELIMRSDAVLRLPGTSMGGAQETAFALDNNIPVFDDIEQLLEAAKCTSLD